MPRSTLFRRAKITKTPVTAWPASDATGGCRTGTITAVVADRDFGFIRPAEGAGADIVFHASSLRSGLRIGDLNRGDVVAFEVEPDPYGRKQRAVDVHFAIGEARAVLALQ